MPAEGDIFESRYRITSILGEGGFAIVYGAHDLQSATDVALKILKPDRSKKYDRATIARFGREVRLLSQLRSPHTVRLLGSGESADGELYMAFELVPGRDLSEYLAAVQRLPPHLVKTILRQLLLALSEAHDLGLIHRDLKPENIRVFETPDEPLSVKLLDFGIARSTDDGHPSITRTGELIGTPRYMAPEQILEHPLTPASDIYSLGMVTLELVVGRDHLPSNRFGDQFDRLVTGYVFSIPEAERLGPELIDLILKMTARAPGDRFPNASAALTALDGARDMPPGVAPPFDPPLPDKPHLPAYNPQPTDDRLPPPPRVVPSAAPAPPPPRRQNQALAGLAIVVFAVGLVLWASADDAPNEETAPPTTSPPPTPPKLKRLEPAPADPEEVIARQTTGCGGSPPSFDCEGAFCTHTPRDYDSARKYPLLVLGHPHGVEAKEFMARFEGLADEKGIVLLAPKGEKQPPWKDEDGDDIVETVDSVKKEYCIDEDRIFAFGSQDGGKLVSRLDCTKVPAAVAFHSYLYQDDPLSPGPFKCAVEDKPMPSIWIAPTESVRWPYQGGGHCLNKEDNTLSVPKTADAWAKRNRCARVKRPRKPQLGCVQLDCPEHPTTFCAIPGGTSPHKSPDCDWDKDESDFDEVIADAWTFFETVAPAK